ncbi:hypothetical protein AGOR_G00213490 [Albula goreensis]|uniref:Uncharacterized protein n=1 Tax=Albula goreensis TaxID=1534307 RepID=A0A8T3CRN3_9TELE|nr:hypothetical protein AGOR_G00213490 [Albula goreensis]
MHSVGWRGHPRWRRIASERRSREEGRPPPAQLVLRGALCVPKCALSPPLSGAVHQLALVWERRRRCGFLQSLAAFVIHPALWCSSWASSVAKFVKYPLIGCGALKPMTRLVV